MIRPGTSGYRYVANDRDRSAGFPLLIIANGSSVHIRRRQKSATGISPVKGWRRNWGNLARWVSVRLAEMTYREWYYHPIDSILYQRENRRIFCYARNQTIPLWDPTDLFEITFSMGELIFERSREQKLIGNRPSLIGCYREVRHVQDVSPDGAATGRVIEDVREE